MIIVCICQAGQEEPHHEDLGLCSYKVVVEAHAYSSKDPVLFASSMDWYNLLGKFGFEGLFRRIQAIEAVSRADQAAFIGCVDVPVRLDNREKPGGPLHAGALASIIATSTQ
jgi:hypothetical protein